MATHITYKDFYLMTYEEVDYNNIEQVLKSNGFNEERFKEKHDLKRIDYIDFHIVNAICSLVEREGKMLSSVFTLCKRCGNSGVEIRENGKITTEKHLCKCQG